MSCLLKSHYRVNNILFTEIRAPKTASATVKARKRGDRMQTAAVLTSNVSQPSSETAQHEISEKEVTAARQTGGRSVYSRAFVDKENIAPTERDGDEGNLERSFWTSLDDIPLEQGPRRARFHGASRGESLRIDGQRVAARSLPGLSQFR